MEPHPSLDTMSSRHKVVAGSAIALVGLLVSALMLVNPETLRVPLWVALAANATFIIAGFAVAIHGFVSRKTYAGCMAGLLVLMACVPGWIAFGPGSRECTASVPFLGDEGVCRWVFGIGALITFAMALAATRAAVTSREA
jgi:hypothetical protein